MCPHTHYLPTISAQSCVGVAITPLVGNNLRAPEFGVLLWPGGVFGTAMPKTAIYEYGDTRAYEGDVRNPPRLDENQHMKAIPEAKDMEFAAQR